MEKHTRQIQAGKALKENINASGAGTQHRFELDDPLTRTKHRYQTADAVRAKAAELGAIQFQVRSADGATIQIKQADGEWRAEDGRSLAAIQAGIDKESVAAIEARAALRAVAGGVVAQTDRQMAQADIADARRIQSLGRLERAFSEMSKNARASIHYKESLSDTLQGHGTVHQKMEAISRQRVERAGAWSPEEAARQARQDDAELRLARTPEERFYLGYQMGKNRNVNPHYHAALLQAERGAEGNAERAQANPAPRSVAGPANDPASAVNSIEPDLERKQQRHADEKERARAARARSAADGQTAPAQRGQASNKVESDEVFTAGQRDKQVVPPEIERQYLRVGDKFYHPKNTDRVAFEDKGTRLETKSNSKSIADAMVRIAEARGWDEIKVSGSEVFRKEVWLEAASRGMHVKGYSPSELDKAELARQAGESKAKDIASENKPVRLNKRPESEEDKPLTTSPPSAASPAKSKGNQAQTAMKEMARVFSTESPADAVKKHPELAGAAAALAAMEKKAELDGLNPAQRAVVTARLRKNVANSIERGEIPEVRVAEKTEVKRDRKAERGYAP